VQDMVGYDPVDKCPRLLLRLRSFV